jgi:hypothetical protein
MPGGGFSGAGPRSPGTPDMTGVRGRIRSRITGILLKSRSGMAEFRGRDGLIGGVNRRNSLLLCTRLIRPPKPARLYVPVRALPRSPGCSTVIQAIFAAWWIPESFRPTRKAPGASGYFWTLLRTTRSAKHAVRGAHGSQLRPIPSARLRQRRWRSGLPWPGSRPRGWLREMAWQSS